MKKLIFLPFTLALSLHSFEPGQLSLDSVSNLEAGKSAFGIRHRFYGDITKSEDFFGMDDGGNIMLSLRHALTNYLVLETHHTRENGEYNVALGYAYNGTWVHTQLNYNYYSFEEPLTNARTQSYFINAVIQSSPIFEHLRLSTNIGYDAYYKKAGAGVSTELLFNNPFPVALTFTESISIIAEYYSRHQGLENFNTAYNAYAAGIKFQTFAHHFEILATNATALDPRVMMQGTQSNVVHFGFNINRKF